MLPELTPWIHTIFLVLIETAKSYPKPGPQSCLRTTENWKVVALEFYNTFHRPKKKSFHWTITASHRSTPSNVLQQLSIHELMKRFSLMKSRKYQFKIFKDEIMLTMYHTFFYYLYSFQLQSVALTVSVQKVLKNNNVCNKCFGLLTVLVIEYKKICGIQSYYKI